MKAAVFYGKGDIRVDEHYPMPAVGPESVLIQVKACGVCGTDVHIYGGAQGATECNPPVILGHEFSGVVTQVGSAVTRVKVGDHVTVNPNISCDACDQCRRGNPHFCDSMAATGVNYDGGFAEYCAVLERQVFKVPEGVPFEEAALCEPVACALHGIDLCGIKPGDTVMVIGGGPREPDRGPEGQSRQLPADARHGPQRGRRNRFRYRRRYAAEHVRLIVI